MIASFCIVHLSDSEVTEFIAQISTLLNSNGHLYLSFIEGDQTGFMKPDFFDVQVYFHFYNRDAILQLLAANLFQINDLYEYDYLAEDGTASKEIFIFAQKISP